MQSEEEEDEEEDTSGSDGEGRAAAAPRERKPIYDADAIHEKLEDIAWAEEQAWEETQVVTGEEPTEVDNVEDDLGRELAFYNQVGPWWGAGGWCEEGGLIAGRGGCAQRRAVVVLAFRLLLGRLRLLSAS